ncbi:hypothetical protein HWV62_10317 [Athelia sp. TMB]|nr:hypothetical protein HWV62_10317 [Athelia sp. TMB]
MLFRPTFIFAQLVTFSALLCLFASTADAAPAPQFGVPWRKGSLGETRLADMRPSASASESAPASATLAGGEIIYRSFKLPAAAATQSPAPYEPGNIGQVQVQAHGVISRIKENSATQMAMGASASAAM